MKKGDEVQVLLKGLSPGCHQIDVKDSHLYITDTYNNCIKVFDLMSRNMSEYYSIGRLLEGRASNNYGHINSIFLGDKYIYLLCHNETRKTERSSEVLVLNKEFEVNHVVKTNSGHAHNLLPFLDQFLHCDSQACSLNMNDKKLFQADMFTRGLSVSYAGIILGGSEYASREKRSEAGGMLYVLNEEFKEMNKIPMPGMVQEVRRIDDLELSFSANYDQRSKLSFFRAKEL